MSGLESISHGDEMARNFHEAVSEPIQLDNPRVQVYLAKLAYPNSKNPMEQWLDGDDTTGTPPLSGPYREYIETLKTSDEASTIDISNDVALSELLKAVKLYAAKSLH